MLRTTLGATHLRVTGMTTRIAGDRSEPLVIRNVARIVDQRPRTVQRGWPEIIRIPGDDVAGAVAHAAADAFDRGIDFPALRRIGQHAREFVVARAAAAEIAFCARHLVE